MPMARLSTFEWACLAVVGLAFAIRIDFILHPDIIWDSAWYLMLARSFAEEGTFWIRWTDPPGYSGYWPPLFPIFLSPLVMLFGASYHTLVAGSVLASALLTAAVFLTTRDMMGRTRAFAAMTLVAVSPAFTSSDARGMSESLLALTVVLTLWALLKGIDKPKWLPVALAFGFLAYLAKANLGVPFVAAGLVGFGVWLGYARGFKRTYGHPAFLLTGLGGLALLATLALTRTGKLGGIGVGVIEPVTRAMSHPLWVPFILFKFVFAASFLLVVTLPFSIHARKALPALDPRKDPKAGTLWLATLLPLAATALFTASFLITEQRGPTQFENVAIAFGESFRAGFIELTATIALLVDFDNVRYLTPALVPFLWLVLPHFPFEQDPARPAVADGRYVRDGHERLFLGAVAAYALLLFLNPMAGSRALPPDQQLGRLFWLYLLALVPLGIALAARLNQYDVVPKTGGRGDVAAWRYVPHRAPFRNPRGTLALVGVGVALAYVASNWFALVGIGALVALASRTARGMVLAVAVVLVAATAANFYTPPPTQEAAEWLGANLPPGTIVGVPEPVVYFAAVAPDGLVVREADFAHGIPPHYDALLLQGQSGLTSPDNFTAVRTWNYSYHFSPPLAARLTIERDLLGKPFGTVPVPGLTLHVRDNSTLADALLGER